MGNGSGFLPWKQRVRARKETLCWHHLIEISSSWWSVELLEPIQESYNPGEVITQLTCVFRLYFWQLCLQYSHENTQNFNLSKEIMHVRSHKCHTIYKTSLNCCGLIDKRSKVIYKDSFSLIRTLKSLPAAGAEKNRNFPSPQYDGGGGGVPARC